MIRHLNNKHFIEMPWKNGKGKTLELFRIPLENEGEFLFRISKAEVNSDGAFSIYPNIDRTLILVSGNGFILKKPSEEISVVEKWKPICFAGEEEIICRLVDGPSKDFNVMVNRLKANAITTVLYTNEFQFQCESDMAFIYNSNANEISILERQDTFHFKQDSYSNFVICQLIKRMST